MRLNLFACCLSLLGTAAFAQNNEWRDPNVNQINRAPMHTNYFAYPNEDSALKGCKESVENYMSLNGTWKFFWVKNGSRLFLFYRLRSLSSSSLEYILHKGSFFHNYFIY